MTPTLDALRNELAVLDGDTIVDGFCEFPVVKIKTRWIFAARQYTDCLWYFWNKEVPGEDKHIPIEKPALTGIVQWIGLDSKEYKGTVNQKLQVCVLAGNCRYVIESGLTTAFSKGLLSNLAQVDLTQPVTIGVEPASDEKVLFAAVFVGDQKICAKQDYEDWAALVHAFNLPKPDFNKDKDSTPAPASIAAEPTVTKNEQYKDRLSKFREFTKHTMPEIAAICKKIGVKSQDAFGDLDAFQLLSSAMLKDWMRLKEVFPEDQIDGVMAGAIYDIDSSIKGADFDAALMAAWAALVPSAEEVEDGGW